MNYAAIANLVHEGVKNSKDLMAQMKQGESSIKHSELMVVEKVLSKSQVSGGTVAIEPPIVPLLLWA